ncbi:MAG: PTS sugar transporter subunit IIA, partial [Alphaproteobacteria bacterium]|nr:PTS sugar transporter subunit IIA [Alphaproteobacteria bacterium]
MEIEDILSADRIVTSLEAGSKKHALQELAGAAARQTGLG